MRLRSLQSRSGILPLNALRIVEHEMLPILHLSGGDVLCVFPEVLQTRF